MLYTYKAVDSKGNEIKGTLEAADKFALYKSLETKGVTVISAKEPSEQKSILKIFSISFGSVKIEDKIIFAKNLSAMLTAGLPLSRSLTVLSRQVKSKQLKDALISIQESLNSGTSFSQSLKQFPKIFSTLFTSMVAAGEESGNLSGSLKIVGEQLEKSYLLQKKIKGAMLYPAVIFGLMIVIAILMFVYVVPSLTSTFKEFKVELPLPTRMIIFVSDFLQNHYLLVILGIITVVVAFLIFVRSVVGKRFLNKFFIKMPFIGLITQELNSARMSRTLSSLLSSGVPVLSALTITSDVVQNVYYKEMLNNVSEQVQKGVALAPLFIERADLYPSFVAEMIGVGEETGTISKVLFDVALFYENEIEQKTKDMSTIIEPLLMIFIGTAVGFFALAIISPIYSLSSAI